MKHSLVRLPFVGSSADCFEATRDSDLFAQTDRQLRELQLPDGTTVEQYIAAGGLERTIARDSRVPSFLRRRVPLPTETGLLTQDEVAEKASTLVQQKDNQ